MATSYGKPVMTTNYDNYSWQLVITANYNNYLCQLVTTASYGN